MELKLPESGPEKNDVVASLARLAKEVVGGVRKNADEKLDEHETHTLQMQDQLEKVAEAFDTDPEASLTPYEMGKEQFSAVVNFIRFLLGKEPSAEEVDVQQVLNSEKGKPSVLRFGQEEVRFQNLDFSKVKDEGERVVQVALSSVAMKDNLDGKHCWDWVDKIYKAAGVKPGEVVFSVANYGAVGRYSDELMKPGAWVYYKNGNKFDKFNDHSAILESFDPQTGKAWMLSFPGPGKLPRRHEVDLKAMPVQRIQLPKDEA